MSSSSDTGAVSAVGAIGSSPSSSSSAYYDAMMQQQLEELEGKAKGDKSHTASQSNSSNDPVEKDWGFSQEEAHKLYNNLCNSFVNQCKEDQDRMKESLKDLQQSTAISG